MFDKKWEYTNTNIKYDSIFDEILKIRASENRESFLNPDLNEMHNPFLMNDMDKAVQRISTAIIERESICVYGDYDADGLTSAAILIRYFKSFGVDVKHFIPNRFDDGYGLNVKSLDLIADEGVKLVITTDCGINSVKEAEFLKKRGIDLIITDHHMSIGELPCAHAVICCTRKDNKYPYGNLSGAGVALKLVNAINNNLSKKKLDENLVILAALGTVTDIVPIDGENRIIVSQGIELMKKGINLGIEAILESAGTKKENINTYTLGFVIGPRINAAGRMGKANLALELLLTDKYEESRKLAGFLSNLNKTRKKEQNDIYNSVLDELSENKDIYNLPVIVAASENYNKGIIGIVASKISEVYKKPCIILSINDGFAEGSGRSMGELSLIDALEYSSGILENYGGHKNAAGVSLKTENIYAFRRKLAEYAEKSNYPGSDGNSMKIDLCVKPDKLTFSEVEKLSRLEPFGISNSKPVLSMTRVKLENYRLIGNNKKHISFGFSTGNSFFKAVCFNSAAYEPLLNIGEIYDIAFNVEIDRFRGNNNIQLLINDISFSNDESYVYDLQIVVLLVHMVKYEKRMEQQLSLNGISDNFYKMGMPDAAKRVLSRDFVSGINRGNIGGVYNEIKMIPLGGQFDIRKFSARLSPDKICLSVEILIELGILKAYREDIYTYNVLDRPVKDKRQLENSSIYRIFN